jgi:hypothetical protein
LAISGIIKRLDRFGQAFFYDCCPQ